MILSYRYGVLRDGYFGWPGRSGLMLADGYFWSRRAGGYNFYVGQNGASSFDHSRPVAACGPDNEEFTFGGLFQADSDYWLAVKTVSIFGLESDDYTWLRLRTDDVIDGKAVPAPVENLRTDLGDTGRIIVRWEYSQQFGWPEPVVFKFYAAYREDKIDFSSPLQGAGGDVEVEFRPTQRKYVWYNEGYIIGSSGPWKIAVRAVTADGVDDGSEHYVIGKGDTTRPGEIEPFQVEQI